MLGLYSLKRRYLMGKEIPIINLRQSDGHPGFIMEIPIPENGAFLVNKRPRRIWVNKPYGSNKNSCHNQSKTKHNKTMSLLWCHNGHDGISNHQPCHCLLNRSDVDQRKHQSSTSLAFVWGIHWWPVNSPHKGASNKESVSIWWRHHDIYYMTYWTYCGGGILGNTKAVDDLDAASQKWNMTHYHCSTDVKDCWEIVIRNNISKH